MSQDLAKDPELVWFFIIFVVVAISIALAVFFAISKRDKRRRERWEAVAKKYGFTFEPKPNITFPPEIALLQFGICTNALWGNRGKTKIIIADLKLETDPIDESHTVCIINDPDILVPHFRLSRETLFKKFDIWFQKLQPGMNMGKMSEILDVDFDNDPQFSKIFELFSMMDQNIVRTYFPENVRTYLLNNIRGFDKIEGLAHTFTLITVKAVPPNAVGKMLSLALSLRTEFEKNTKIALHKYKQMRDWQKDMQ